MEEGKEEEENSVVKITRKCYSIGQAKSYT